MSKQRFLSFISSMAGGYWPAVCLLLAGIGSFVMLLAAYIQVVPTVSAERMERPVVSFTPSPKLHKSKSVKPTKSCRPFGHVSAPAKLDLGKSTKGLVSAAAAQEYSIYGNDIQAVVKQLNRCAPSQTKSSSAGGPYAGNTYYNLNASYGWRGEDNGSCSLTSVKVGLSIITTLPAWQAETDAEPQLETIWNNYIESLRTHEQGHASLDRKYSAKLYQELVSLPPADCANIGEIARTKVQETIGAIDAANAAYDKRTDHGATQGAVLR